MTDIDTSENVLHNCEPAHENTGTMVYITLTSQNHARY